MTTPTQHSIKSHAFAVAFLFAALVIAITSPQHGFADTLSNKIANAQFAPADELTLADRIAEFHRSLSRLRQRLDNDPNGSSWESFLMCERVTTAISDYPGDDVDETEELTNTVSRCYFRLAGLHAGMEQTDIAAYRESLGAVRLAMLQLNQLRAEAKAMELWREDMEMFPDDEELRKEKPSSTSKSFAQKTRRLAELLHSPTVSHNVDDLREIASIVSWLKKREQIPGLLKSVEQRLSLANLDLHVAAAALGDMTVTPAREVEPIDRMEDGVHITGQAVASGHARMVPVDGGGTGRCEVQFTGDVVTTLHGSKGPASFGLRGITALTANKPVILSSEQIFVLQSIAFANTDLNTERVCSKFRGLLGRLVRKIASKQIAEQRPQASRDLSKESATSFLEQFDKQVEDEIAVAQQSLESDLHLPLNRLDLQPKRFDFNTDPEKLRVSLQFGNGFGTTSEPRTSYAGRYDVKAKIHESMINSICDRMLSGRPVRNFRDVIQILGVAVPQDQLDLIPEDVGLHFSQDEPIRVKFDGNRIVVTISAIGWKVSDYDLVGMNVSFGYRLDQSSGKQQFKLDDQFEITAPEGTESGRFFQQKNVLQRLLEKELPPTLPIESIPVSALPEMVDKLGNLSFDWININDGWLQAVIAGDRVTTSSFGI